MTHIAACAMVLFSLAARAVGGEPPSSVAEGPPSDPVRWSGTETFQTEYVGDNGSINEGVYGDDDNFTRFRNILHLGAGNSTIRTGLRLDATMFNNPPYRVTHDDFIPGGSGYTTLNFQNDFRVERIEGNASLGDLEVTLGDFHVNFGRGMILSLLKMDELGEDHALRGARLSYRVKRALKLDIVGGVVNTLNIDPVTRHIIEDDPLDRILGLRGEWQILDAFSIGAHTVMMKPRFTDYEQISSERVFIDQGPGVGLISGGGSLEMHLEGFHVYVEGNGQAHDNFRATDEALRDGSGAAVFGEISYDLSPVSVKGEGIFYRHWLMEGAYRGPTNSFALSQPVVYNHMVTLEPDFIPIKSFGNAFGGRLSGDLYLERADLELSLKSTFIQYVGGLLPRGDWHDHPETLTIHPILAAKKRFSGTDIEVDLSGGGRFETTDKPQISGVDSGHLWHVEGAVTVPIRGPHGIEVKGEVRRHALEVTEGIDYYVTLATVGYHLAGILDVTLAHEYSDELTIDEMKIGSATWPLPAHHYAWIMSSVQMPKPLDGLRLQLFFGSQRGGIKCAGGICRRYPDSLGASVEAVYRF